MLTSVRSIITSVGPVSWSARSPLCSILKTSALVTLVTLHTSLQLSTKHSVSQFIPHFKLHTHWFLKEDLSPFTFPCQFSALTCTQSKEGFTFRQPRLPAHKDVFKHWINSLPPYSVTINKSYCCIIFPS